jgi:lipopolysaccharide export system permease protein
MRIIDRYLLGQFLRTFAIFFLSLTGLIIVFDCVSNLGEYLRCGEKTGGVGKLLLQYYGVQVFGLFDRTNALLTLISVMFTVSWIQRHNEMTALMAAGVSRIRIVKPLILAAVFVSLLAAANRELMIPRFREQLTRRPQDLLGDRAQSLAPQYDYQTGVQIGGKNTFADRKRIEDAKFLLPRSLCEDFKEIRAENAFYLPAKGERPNGYLLEKVQEPSHINTRPSIAPEGKPLLVTPHDPPRWIKLQPDQCFIVSNLDFDQLTGGIAFRQYSSIRQLVSGLNNPSVDFQPDVRVAVHARIVQPLLDLTLLFLGLPLVLRRESRNVFLTIGICIVVTSGFLMTVMGFQYLGAISLIKPAALAAWAPLMLFVPLAVVLAQPMWE